jgi:ribosomal protein L31
MVGCSSNPVKIAEGTKTIETTKPITVTTPEWYVTLPREDGALYAAATEASSDLQFSIDRAVMSAQRELAFRLNNEVSQKYRDYTAETGSGENETITKDTERLTISNSKYINIVGIERLRTEVVREGNRYRAYVLVRYGLDASNKIHANYMAKQRKQDARERLDEFDKELKGQQAPKIESNVKLDKSDLLGPKVSDASVRERVQRVYDDPNAVIIRETVR